MWSPCDSAAEGDWWGYPGPTRGLSISLSVASRTQIAESFHAVRIRAGRPRRLPGSARVANCLGRSLFHPSLTMKMSEDDGAVE